MVLSCWVDGAPGGFVARVTMSGAGHEASVRTLTKREQVHAVVDEWLDELLGHRRADQAPRLTRSARCITGWHEFLLFWS